MKTPIKVALITVTGTIFVAIIAGVFSRNGTSTTVKTGDQHDGSVVVGGDADNVESTTVKTGDQHDSSVFITFEGDVTDSEFNIGIHPNETNEIEALRDKVENVTVALVELDQRTSGIEKLPDGRTRRGDSITGDPTIVLEEHNAAYTFYKEKNFASALEHSKRAIQAYEETQQELMKMMIIKRKGRKLNESEVAKIYHLGALIAHNLKKHEQAYKWAEKANSLESNAKQVTFLAVTLFNVNRQTDALQIVDEGLVQYPNNPVLVNLRNEISKRAESR